MLYWVLLTGLPRPGRVMYFIFCPGLEKSRYFVKMDRSLEKDVGNFVKTVTSLTCMCNAYFNCELLKPISLPKFILKH